MDGMPCLHAFSAFFSPSWIYRRSILVPLFEGGAYLSGIYIGVPDPRGDLYLKALPILVQMHFRELPTNAVVFLHLPGRPALVILLDITDRKTVQIIIFYDDIIPLAVSIPRSSIVPGLKVRHWNTDFVSSVLYTLAVTSSKVSPEAASIRAHKNLYPALGSLASLLHLLDRFPSRFVRMGVQQHTELLGKVFQRICITVSFDIHQIRHGTLSANLAGEALEQILAGADREFFASALGHSQT